MSRQSVIWPNALLLVSSRFPHNTHHYNFPYGEYRADMTEVPLKDLTRLLSDNGSGYVSRAFATT